MLIDVLKLGMQANPEERIIHDYDRIARISAAFRYLQVRVALTSGSWDLFHIGHAKYLEKVKEMTAGGVLIVGVDDDQKIKSRKGEDRPIVPCGERLELLTHIRYVDLVFLKNYDDPHQALIKAVKPHILVLTDTSSYAKNNEEIKQLQELLNQWQGLVEILPRQAITSTSGRLREVVLKDRRKIIKRIEQLSQQLEDA